MSASAAISALNTAVICAESSLAPNASELSDAACDIFMFVLAISAFLTFLLEVKRFMDGKS